MDFGRYQRAVVAHHRGPMLVSAVPESGKTTTLASQVLRLVAEGTDPTSIMVVTFSRSAAKTFRRRLLDARVERARPVAVATFHGLALRLLGSIGRRSADG